eukprot:4189895-Amphidinium_carterae.1
MDARDAMRCEQLMADFVTSGAWDKREAPFEVWRTVRLNSHFQASRRTSSCSYSFEFVGIPFVTILAHLVVSEPKGFTENCEIVGTGFSKDREAAFDSDADSLTWEDLAAQGLPIRNFASLEEEWQFYRPKLGEVHERGSGETRCDSQERDQQSETPLDDEPAQSEPCTPGWTGGQQ